MATVADAWRPTSEFEHRLQETVRAGDQEGYFRLLADSELVVPVPPELVNGVLANETQPSWPTQEEDGRVHVLVYTSASAMRACLGPSYRHFMTVRFGDIAETWPDARWWLAIDAPAHGVGAVLPIEARMPAWFVRQVAEGDGRPPQVGRAPAAWEELRDQHRELPRQSPRPEFQPANDVERELLRAAANNDHDLFLQTLAATDVLLPVPPDLDFALRPGRPGFPWQTREVDGSTVVPVFTSPERLTEASPPGTEYITLPFTVVLRYWPNHDWLLAINSGSPAGGTVLAQQLPGLATWADQRAAQRMTDRFEPQNDIEQRLFDTARRRDTEAFYKILLGAQVLVPADADTPWGIVPGDPEFPWRPIPVHGRTSIQVFTSLKWMNDAIGSSRFIMPSLHEMVTAWPDTEWTLVLNPGTPIDASMPGEQLRTLRLPAAPPSASTPPPPDTPAVPVAPPVPPDASADRGRHAVPPHEDAPAPAPEPARTTDAGHHAGSPHEGVPTGQATTPVPDQTGAHGTDLPRRTPAPSESLLGQPGTNPTPEPPLGGPTGDHNLPQPESPLPGPTSGESGGLTPPQPGSSPPGPADTPAPLAAESGGFPMPPQDAPLPGPAGAESSEPAHPESPLPGPHVPAPPGGESGEPPRPQPESTPPGGESGGFAMPSQDGPPPGLSPAPDAPAAPPAEVAPPPPHDLPSRPVDAPGAPFADTGGHTMPPEAPLSGPTDAPAAPVTGTGGHATPPPESLLGGPTGGSPVPPPGESTGTPSPGEAPGRPADAPPSPPTGPLAPPTGDGGGLPGTGAPSGFGEAGAGAPGGVPAQDGPSSGRDAGAESPYGDFGSADVPAARPVEPVPPAVPGEGEAEAPGARGLRAVAEPEPEPEPAFEPGNRIDQELYEAASSGDSDAFLRVLLNANVLVPIPDEAPLEVTPIQREFRWDAALRDASSVRVFTSLVRLREVLPESRFVYADFRELIGAWPREDWAMLLNPGTRIGASLQGGQVRALSEWAVRVGLVPARPEVPLLPPPRPEPEPEPEPEPARLPSDLDDRVSSPTIMQKVVPHGLVSWYLEQGYDRVGGFVHSTGDVAELQTPGQLYETLGLLYDGSPFSPADDGVYVIRWPAYCPSLYRVPFGGRDEAELAAWGESGWVIERPPFLGGGFAPGSAGSIREYKVDSARLPYGAEMYYLGRDRTERFVAMYDPDRLAWLRPEGSPEGGDGRTEAVQ
ncbi:SseB family protein [Actinomadura sp. NAK00032]|uniref:SseB family protein n=1 Tax=Actinomadura sp. NAK00032 TaxID=2742128 RepID=UPI00158FE875|nr:SseB family protein [Actinomadura sp. NAK00032]QKW38360.1 SseB family protein [Actinomadura sp. NAK00032]